MRLLLLALCVLVIPATSAHAQTEGVLPLVNGVMTYFMIVPQ
jgi:hypothetical protein